MVDHEGTGQNDATAAPGGDAATPGEPPAGRKQRRWGRRLVLLAVIFLLGIGMLVGAAPYLAGNAAVRNFALARVNAGLRGDLEVAGLSTGWSGPTVITGFKVIDPDTETVLEVAEVRVPGGVWRLARDYLHFGTVTIDGAQVRLRLDESNNISLVDAFASTADQEPPPEEMSSPLPAPVGQVELREAFVVVEWPDGRRRLATGVDATIQIDTLNTLSATIEAAVETLGGVVLNADIKELFAGGQLNLDGVSAVVALESKGELQLAAVDRLLDESIGLQGTGGLELKAGLAGGKLDMTLVTRPRLLRLDALGTEGAPLDLDLTVKGIVSKETLDATVTLTGGMGDVRIAALGNPLALAEGFDAGSLLAGLADGDAVDLPGFTIDVDGRVDLAALDRAMPGMIPLREGQRLRSGIVRLEGIKLEGGASPIARGRVAIDDVEADIDAKRVSLSPISLEFDAAVDASAGLLVRRAELQSPFATLTGAGTLRDLDAVFSVSLGRMRDELSQFIDLSGYAFNGDIDGRLQLAQPTESTLDANLTVNARQAVLVMGGQAVQPADADQAAEAKASARAGRGVDFKLTTKMAMDRSDAAMRSGTPLNAALTLDGGLGNLQLAVRGDPASLAEGVDVDGVVAALVDGGAVRLPGFALDADGRLDVAAVDRLLPGMLPLREGQRLRSGSVRVEGVRLSGGSAPVARGRIALDDVAAEIDAKRVTLSPVSLDFDAGVDAATGLLVRRAELQSPFAKLTGAGSLRDLDASFSANLDRVRDELGQFMDLSAYAFKGDVAGQLKLAQPDRNTIDVDFTADARETAVAWGDQNVQVRQAHIGHVGQVLLVDGGVDRITASRLTIDIADEIAAVLNGAWAMEESSGNAEIILERMDVAAVAQRLAGFGVTLPHAYTGQARGTLTAAVGADMDRVQSAGHLVIEDPTADGAPIETGTVQLQWRDAEVVLSTLAARVADLKVEAAPLRLQVNDGAWSNESPLLAEGTVAVSGQVGPVVQSVRRLAAMDSIPEMEGNLDAQFILVNERGRQKVTGGGSVRSAVVELDGRKIREPNLRFQCVAEVDHAEASVDVGQLVVRTAPVEVDLSGRLTDYSGALLADLSGTYAADWGKATALLHAYMPDMKDDLRLAGKHSDAVRFKGSLMDWNPVAMEGTTSVSVTSAHVYGVDLESISVPLRLADGQMVMPPTDLRTQKGIARVAGTLDLRASPPVLTLREPTRVLDKVAVTPELSKSMLSRVNPIFMHLADVQGLVSLEVTGLEVPLGDTLKSDLDAEAQLALVDMVMEPAGLLGELMVLAGMPRSERYVIRPQAMAIQIHDGRIAYDDFTLAFRDGLSLKFFGSVGLDETLDLAVSVPVTDALLQRTGVRGSTARYLQVLKGLRVDVPIVGTRNSPRLDLARVDMQGMFDRAIRETATETIQDTVGGILGDFLKGSQPKPKNGDRKDEGDRKRD